MRSKAGLLLFWDFLVWTLGVAVFLLGGAQIEWQGFRLDLNQVGLHSLLLFFFALTLQKCNLDWRSASSIRFLQNFFQTWQRRLEKNPLATLFSGIFFVGFFWGWLSIRRHNAFASNAADLGIFTNALWNIVNNHGYFSSLKGGINLMADHQSPLLCLFAPIFSLWPKAENLLLQQGFFLALTALPIFGLAKIFLPGQNKLQAMLPLLFWASTPIRNTALFEFHPEILMLPFFLSAAWALFQKKLRWQISGAILFIFALGAKESAAPVGIGLLSAIALNKQDKLSAAKILVLLSLLLTCIYIFYFNFYFLPRWLNSPQAYVGSYAGLGNSPLEILFSPLLSPTAFWLRIFSPSRIQFFLSALFPFALIPLLAPRLFLAAIPGFAMLFLSVGDHRITTGYHYIIEPGVGIWLALPAGLAFLLKRFPFLSVKILYILPLCTLFLFGKSDMWRWRAYAATPHQTWLKDTALPSLSQLPLSADNALVPHLADRHWIAYNPELKIGKEDQVSCIVRDSSVNAWPLDGASSQKLNTQIATEYRLQYKCGSFSVYERAGGGNTCLKAMPECYAP